MPNYIKKPIEPLLQDKEVKTSFTDINKFVSGVVNGVDAKAQWCNWEHKLDYKWWGFRMWLNNCLIKDINQSTNSVALIGGAISGYCGYIGLAACSFVAGALSAIFGWGGGTLSWLSDQCGGAGAVIKRLHTGQIWFFRAC
jgi:hypothetical protein